MFAWRREVFFGWNGMTLIVEEFFDMWDQEKVVDDDGEVQWSMVLEALREICRFGLALFIWCVACPWPLAYSWESFYSHVEVCWNGSVDIIDHGYHQTIFVAKNQSLHPIFLKSSSPLRPHSADMHPAASFPQCNSSCLAFH